MPWSEEILCWQWLIFTWCNNPNSPHSFSHSSVGKESACNAGDPSSTLGSGRSAGEGTGYPLQYFWASLVAQLVKNLPAMWKTWVWFLGLVRSPGEGKGYPLQYSGLENSMDWIVMGSQRVRQDWATFTFVPRGSLVPWPGMERVSPALEVWRLNHCTAKKVPSLSF